MTDGSEGSPDPGGEGRARRTRRPVREEQRVPAWVVIPLAAAAGFLVSSIPGGVFGLLVGLGLWWSRR